MTRLLPLLAVGLLLSGCASMPGGAGNTDVAAMLTEIAKDPNCGHTDRISGNLGGLGGNNLNVFLERTCAAKAP